MKKTLVVGAVILAVASVGKAQSVSPLFVEAKNKIKSQITVQNFGVQPMAVTVEAREMVLIDGKASLQPVGPGVHLELVDTSAVVAPKASRTFDYKVTSDHDTLVVILAGMVNGKPPKDGGVIVKLWMPSSQYLCPQTGEKGCRDRVKKALAL